MAMTKPDVNAARAEVLAARQAAFELLYTATKFQATDSITLALKQLRDLDTRDNCLANIEGLINAIAQLPPAP